MKYFAIFDRDTNNLCGFLGSTIELFRSRKHATETWNPVNKQRYKVVPVELKICTPSRRANSAAKQKEVKMASAKKVVKKPAGEPRWPLAAKKVKLKPKATGKK